VPGYERTYTPVSNYLFNAFRGVFADYLLDENNYESSFDRFELLLALSHADHDPDQWGPIGCFGWRRKRSRFAGFTAMNEDTSVLVALKTEATAAGNQWPPLQAGFFGGSIVQFTRVADGFGNWLAQATATWR